MTVSVTHESRRISNKIVSLVLLLELISIAIWGTFTYQGSKDELIKSISNELAETANHAQTEIGGFFSPIMHFADFLSGARYSMGLDDEEVTRLLYLFLSQRPEVKEVSLVGADGRESVRLSQIESFGPQQLRQLSSYEVQDALRGLAKMGPISFSRYFEPEITYAIPLGGLSGQPKVVLYATVSLKWLWDVLQNQTFGESGYVYIVDENFQLIAHNDPSIVRIRRCVRWRPLKCALRVLPPGRRGCSSRRQGAAIWAFSRKRSMPWFGVSISACGPLRTRRRYTASSSRLQAMGSSTPIGKRSNFWTGRPWRSSAIAFLRCAFRNSGRGGRRR